MNQFFMSEQVRIEAGRVPAVVAEGGGTPAAWRRALLRACVAWRLGPRPVGFWLLDRALRGVARWRLRDGTPAAALPRPDWHGPYDPAAHCLALDLRAARPVWEASRLGELPLLALRDPAAAEALLADWCAANPPFRGVNWACGQEAALRAMHVSLVLALTGTDHHPPEAARRLLELTARRIAATPFYALAQDNNHPISEAAGAFCCALLLRRPTHRHARALAARVARLVAPDGGFAQVSPGYARLALDVLAIAEWLRRRHAAPSFPAPLAQRAAALARWLHRLADPLTGATPPLGLEDGSAFADLSRRGPHDARGSIERALRLFAGEGGDAPDDPGCALLGLPPAPHAARPPRWRAEGTMGWHEGGAFALLRTGRLRFRPGQADLLHLSLRDGGEWIIRDGGTGSYDPPDPWWDAALAGAAGHDAAIFDGAEPMPRLGRFLFAAWPRVTALPDGAALRDTRGNHQARRVTLHDRLCTIEDTLAGPFRRVTLRWRLAPGPWRLAPGACTGPSASITISADAPVSLALRQGWESPGYGRIAPAPLLVVDAEAPVTRITTRIRLPAESDCLWTMAPTTLSES